MAEDFLAAMAAASAERARATLAQFSLEELESRAMAAPLPPSLKLNGSGFDVIAEVKLRAPSAGELAPETTDVVGLALNYARAGAAAVSVLTEPARFGGSLEHLGVVADALREHGVPAMRKDFLVHPSQVFEARAAGAGGVLLILPILADDLLAQMLETARAAGLFVLLEAFDADDLARCHTLDHSEDLLLGLNCRNLRSLAVEPARFAELVSKFPNGLPRVAESGLASAADVAAVAELGYELALVGSALMQAKQPDELLADMLAAGREQHA